LTTMRASTANKRTFSLEGAARRELKAAGWKPEVGVGGTIWQSPKDRHWYDELRAISLPKEDVDPGVEKHEDTTEERRSGAGSDTCSWIRRDWSFRCVRRGRRLRARDLGFHELLKRPLDDPAQKLCVVDQDLLLQLLVRLTMMVSHRNTSSRDRLTWTPTILEDDSRSFLAAHQFTEFRDTTYRCVLKCHPL
jgi:hypothetical protein